MSIVPASALTSAELHLLGNNTFAAARSNAPDVVDRNFDSVNRSFSSVGEKVDLLEPLPAASPVPKRSRTRVCH